MVLSATQKSNTERSRGRRRPGPPSGFSLPRAGSELERDSIGWEGESQLAGIGFRARGAIVFAVRVEFPGSVSVVLF